MALSLGGGIASGESPGTNDEYMGKFYLYQDSYGKWESTGEGWCVVQALKEKRYSRGGGGGVALIMDIPVLQSQLISSIKWEKCST